MDEKGKSLKKNISRQSTKHSRGIVTGSILVVFLLLVTGFLMQPAYAIDQKTQMFIDNRIKEQEKTEQELRAYYMAGEYHFENPLVIQDPYKTAPLTALVIFDTEEPSQISLHIPGGGLKTAVDFAFPGYSKHHELPILGLYANTLNHVTLSMQVQGGGIKQTEIDLQTEPLPLTTPIFRVDFADANRYSPGFNFPSLDFKPVFDLEGNVRWYSSRESFRIFSRMENGHFLFTYLTGDQKQTAVFEQDLLGKIYTTYYIEAGIHHDIHELPGGNLLMTSSDPLSGTIEDLILEIDRRNGHIIRTFDLKDYLDVSRPAEIGLPENDWLHMNSIVYDPSDRSIIFSSRAQSAVVKMSYPGMQIKWILGSHDNWSEKYQPYLLTPLGENFEWPWSQHHATLLTPRNPDENILDILLYDNGQYRSFDLATAFSPPESYSRVVHYRIDEEAMIIEQIWEYGKERGPALLSTFGGSAYQLSNANVLGDWGSIARDSAGNPVLKPGSNDSMQSTLIEIDPQTDQVIFECTVPGQGIYRAFRAGFYDGYSVGNAYLTTGIRDTSANDLYERGQLAWQDVKRWTNTVPVLVSIKRLVHQILGVFR